MRADDSQPTCASADLRQQQRPRRAACRRRHEFFRPARPPILAAVGRRQAWLAPMRVVRYGHMAMMRR